MAMGTSYLKTTTTMNSLGVTIRKISISKGGRKENISSKDYNKQILTLHRKLKKIDKKMTTSYVVERDNRHKRKFHMHLLINYTDKTNLYNQLSRFIGGNIWKERKEGLDTIYGCNGKYGEVDTHCIYNEIGFINYMNKDGLTKTLI
jgi:hypothetical protein